MATITEALGIAFQHHEAGRLTEAEILYNRILEADPRQPNALHLLGMLLCQLQRPDESIPLLKCAAELDPFSSTLRFDLARARLMLAEQGDASQWTVAIGGLQLAIALQPDHHLMLFQLALALRSCGSLPQACAQLRHVLRLVPGYRDAHRLISQELKEEGRRRLEAGDFGGALSRFFDPILGDAGREYFIAQGFDLLKRGKSALAGRFYRGLLIMDPAEPAAILNETLCRLDLTGPGSAERFARRACALVPESAVAHLNYGLVLKALDRNRVAAAEYRYSLACDPAQVSALANLAACVVEEGEDEAACLLAERSVRVSPERSDLAAIQANLLSLVEADSNALAVYRSIIKAEPDNAEAHWGLAMMFLRQGDYAQGWVEYEWRWRSRALDGQHRNFAQPRWRGERLEGRSILVHAEQGIGDTIQFIRFLDRVVDAGPEQIYLEAHAPLHPLLEPNLRDGPVTLIFRARDFPGTGGLPDVDVQIPLMSLAGLFCNAVSDIPHSIPYLAADPVRSGRWAERIGRLAVPDSIRCGLVWAGRPQYKADASRSLRLAALDPLSKVPGVSFFSLQVGEATREIAGSLCDPVDLSDGLTDFAETAAAMENLDLIVTVDTAVAHLAGALGRPVWLLLPRNCDWRWLKDREDSPWYPTARLFRQRVRGDWSDPVASMFKELQDFVRNP